MDGICRLIRQDLITYLSQYGQVKDIALYRDPSGRQKNNGVVVFMHSSTSEAVYKAGETVARNSLGSRHIINGSLVVFYNKRPKDIWPRDAKQKSKQVSTMDN